MTNEQAKRFDLIGAFFFLILGAFSLYSAAWLAVAACVVSFLAHCVSIAEIRRRSADRWSAGKGYNPIVKALAAIAVVLWLGFLAGLIR